MDIPQQPPCNIIRESDVHADPSYKKDTEFFDMLGFKCLFCICLELPYLHVSKTYSYLSNN